ncbi:S24 family peptidase [Vibrio sp. YMD68]|uniref:LexA family transcriptional regulator n=1 Tax=Vibrio sp. YMD68 TaxID=3042300 RepID=UPI00249AE902|nr:S24 family peptidase [Vibrio sp. YMD68]WGW01578.1 S24 family peptidase [Vibrio sp. YMD68]
MKERLETLLKGRSIRQTAADWGIAFNTLRNWLTKGTSPSFDVIAAIAKLEGVDLNWLAYGESSLQSLPTASPMHKDSVEVIQYDFKASAGAGCLVVSENPVAKFEFSREWLIKQGLNGKHLTVVEVYGDSMEPTLLDEDLMLVEVIEDPKQARDGVCVLRIDDEVMVKRVQYDFASGGYRITSDNTAYEPFFIGKEFEGRFQLLGRMVRVLQRAKKHN